MCSGIGNVIGGVVNGLANVLSLIPKTLQNLLDGLLGSSQRGDFKTLHKHLLKLIVSLPGELSKGGQNEILATLHTLESIVENMEKSIRRRRAKNVDGVLESIQDIVEILQAHITNAGARATLTNVIVQLQLLQQAPAGIEAKFLGKYLRDIQVYLNAAIDGLQSGSTLGGMTNDRLALQSVFFIFKMITTSFQNSNTKLTGTLLQQLQYLISGLGE